MRATVLALLATCALTSVARAQDSLVRQVFRCLDTTTGLYHTCPGAAADQSVMQQLGNAVGTQVPTNIPGALLRLDQSSKIPAAQIPFGTTSGTVGAGDAVQSNANAISTEANTARSGEKAAMDAANAAAVTATAAAPASALVSEATTARAAEKANSDAAAAAQAKANSAVPATGGGMTGPLGIGTSAVPVQLSTAPSQDALSIYMISPGTPGAPGPGTAHHGPNATCIKKGFFGTSPGVGEMDCLNIVARQDGLTSDGSDAGDLGGILADVQSTLRAQNFTALLEAHTSVVDTRTNTTPYYLDMQEGVINTAGHPNDDGTQANQSQMQAWFAALIDGHGSGIKLVEQNDPNASAGKLGHGVIDHVLQAGHYDGEQFVDIDGNGNLSLPDGNIRLGVGTKGIGGSIVAPTFSLGTDGNGNLSLGSGAGTPYADFNAAGNQQNVRIISSHPGELDINQNGGQSIVLARTYNLFPAKVVTSALTLSGGSDPGVSYSADRHRLEFADPIAVPGITDTATYNGPQVAVGPASGSGAKTNRQLTQADIAKGPVAASSVASDGPIYAPAFSAGGDAIGSVGIGNTSLATSTPYLDFNGWGTSRNIRLINSALSEISILQTNGAALAVLNANALAIPGDMKIGAGKALWLQNGQTATCYLAMGAAGTISCNDSQGDNWVFGSVEAKTLTSDGFVYLDANKNMWVQESSGKILIGSGSTNLFSIDASGNVRAKGTVTGSVAP